MILVVGDVMDDLVVRPLGPLVPRSDTPAHMERHPGGSGANTAAWLGVLGAEVRFAGRVGLADLRRHARALEACGVDARLAGDARTPTGSIVVLAHDRSMFTDRGANLALGRDDLPDDLLEGVEHVHVSGYSLLEDGPRAAVLDLVARGGVPWSVDPASHAFVADTPFLEWTAGASLCFPNEDEARVLGDGLADAYEVVVLKRGREGVRVLRRGAEPVDVPATTAAAVDQTGAGDAFAAGYLAALVRGEDDAACARAAVRAATEAVGRPGRAAAVGALRLPRDVRGAARPGHRGRARGAGAAAGGRFARTVPDYLRKPTVIRDGSRRVAPAQSRWAFLPRCPGRAAPRTPRQPRRYRSSPSGIPPTPTRPGPAWTPMTGPISDTKSGSLPKISRPLATRRSQTSGAWMCWMTQPSAPSSWRARR